MVVHIERFDGYGAVFLSELNNCERKLGYSLPEDYREFLLQFNGGKPSPSSLRLSDGSVTTIRAFYAVAPPSQTMSLERQIGQYRNRIPPRFIPIGEDPGGNRICICLNGKHYGQVFFWDHEMESDEVADNRNMTFVASTFSSLLDGLNREPVPADRNEIVSFCRAGSATEVRAAIKRGASPNLTSEQGFTLGCIAAGNDQVEVLKVLLEEGANLEDAVSFAAMNGKDNALQFLLSLQLNVNLQDKDGRTPLMNAVIFQHPKCVELLLEAGADLHATWKGKTVEELARGDSREVILDLIRQRSAREGNN